MIKRDKCRMKCNNLAKHQRSETCRKNSRRRGNELKQDAQGEVENISFAVNGKLIQRVKRFLYLGRWFDQNDDDSCCIHDNIKKARGQ